MRPSQGCRRHFAQEALGPSYAVIGGGISGLSMAYFLMKRKPSARVTLFELTDRVGGWIKTDHAALSNGRGAFSLFEDPLIPHTRSCRYYP